MFGSKRIKELEAANQELKRRLDIEYEHNKWLLAKLAAIKGDTTAGSASTRVAWCPLTPHPRPV